jgi:predicted secreted protein
MVAIRNLKGGKYDWSITGKGEGETKVDGKYTLEVRSTKEIKLKFNTLRSVSLYHDGNE